MSFPIYRCQEWQCRYVFPEKLCCILPVGHDGAHKPAAIESAAASIATLKEHANALAYDKAALQDDLAEAEQEIATLKAELAHERELARNDPAEQAAARYAMEAHELAGRLIEAEQARAALREALLSARPYVEAHCGAKGLMGGMAEINLQRLDAVLRSPVERTRDEEKDLTRQSSASTAPGMGISAIPTRKAHGDD